jgi:hypothetical protein
MLCVSVAALHGATQAMEQRERRALGGWVMTAAGGLQACTPRLPQKHLLHQLWRLQLRRLLMTFGKWTLTPFSVRCPWSTCSCTAFQQRETACESHTWQYVLLRLTCPCLVHCRPAGAAHGPLRECRHDSPVGCYHALCGFLAAIHRWQVGASLLF